MLRWVLAAFQSYRGGQVRRQSIPLHMPLCGSNLSTIHRTSYGCQYNGSWSSTQMSLLLLLKVASNVPEDRIAYVLTVSEDACTPFFPK